MKVLIVTTVSGTVNAFLGPHIELLLEMGHEVDIACNIESEIDPGIRALGFRLFDIGFSRSPTDPSNVKAYRQLKALVVANKYDLVHTHTPVASVCARLACRNLRTTQIMYTAHGFHFFKGAPLGNWVKYFPVEWWLSRYTDELLVMNAEDLWRAQHQLRCRSVKYVPGVGVDLSRFSSPARTRASIRESIGVPHEAVMILSVGELSPRKNHLVVLRALNDLGDAEIHYVIAGTGQSEGELVHFAEEHGITENLHLLGLRSDIPDLLHAADMFVFPSRQEGLPVALMEAMASGLPVVCSNIRGNVDLVEDGVGGFLVGPEAAEEWASRIAQLKDSPNLRQRMGEVNRMAIRPFSLELVAEEMEKIYHSFDRSLRRCA